MHRIKLAKTGILYRAARIALGLSLALVSGCESNPDRPPRSGPTEVRIVNVCGEAIDSVTVHVTGRSYRIGRISAGDSATVSTDPLAESHVELEHSLSPGKRLILDSYFEGGYGGRVRGEVCRDSVLKVDQVLPDHLFGLF